VLHVITRLIVGGAQENTVDSASGFDARSIEAEVLCGPETGPEGSILAEARARGVRVTVEPSLRRALRPLADLRALWRTARFVRRGRFDVVHTHSSKAGIVGRWAAWLAGTPRVVHTVHGWSFHERQPAAVRALYLALERASARITERLVCVTARDVQKGLAARIGVPAQYQVIRSAIDVAGFAAPRRSRAEVRSEWGLPAEAAVVGAVTRLSSQKAPLDLVAAAAEVSRVRPDVRFVIVGDGPERAAVERRIRELGLSGATRLLGLRRDVADLLAGLDVFLLTSLWEGLPRALVQAMAAGVPVVATAVDGCTEVVRDCETGLLVPPGRPDEAARAVLRLLDDPELAGRLRRAARASVDKEFDTERMLAQLASLYLERAASRSG
jgi:glycosyltransferase involved in cell wall biosynthesis